MTLPEFEDWMLTVIHFSHYDEGWFSYECKKHFVKWPTREMRERCTEMRTEYLKGKV